MLRSRLPLLAGLLLLPAFLAVAPSPGGVGSRPAPVVDTKASDIPLSVNPGSTLWNERCDFLISM